MSMTNKEHKQRHIELHSNLDELFTDWIRNGPRLSVYLHAPICDLINWSYKQSINPDHSPTD